MSPTMLRRCRLKRNKTIFNIKKQERIENNRMMKEEQKRRNNENKDLLDSLENYYKTQMDLLKESLEREKVDRKIVELVKKKG